MCDTEGERSFRALYRTAKQRLSKMVLGMFGWMFPFLIWNASKVRRCLDNVGRFLLITQKVQTSVMVECLICSSSAIMD